MWAPEGAKYDNLTQFIFYSLFSSPQLIHLSCGEMISPGIFKQKISSYGNKEDYGDSGPVRGWGGQEDGAQGPPFPTASPSHALPSIPTPACVSPACISFSHVQARPLPMLSCLNHLHVGV